MVLIVRRRLTVPGMRWSCLFAGKNLFDALQSLFVTAVTLSITFLIEHPDDRSDNNDKAGNCDEPGNQYENSFDNLGMPWMRIQI
jgi:hypothetical protein